MRHSSGRLVVLILGVGVVGALSAPVAATPSRQQPALVTLVHGVRGLVADIYLDGETVLEVFEPERVTDPLPIPAGEHLVEVRPTGTPATSEPLLSETVTVPASGRFSAVVHLAADGSPALSVFEDDVSTIPAGQARGVVRHAAAVGPVDVTIGDRQVATGLANGSEGSADLPPGEVPISVTSGGQPVIPTEQAPLVAGTARVFYLIGAADDASLTWLTQSVDGLAAVPRSVNTGSGGLAAPPRFPALAVGTLAAVALLSLAWVWRRPRT